MVFLMNGIIYTSFDFLQFVGDQVENVGALLSPATQAAKKALSGLVQTDPRNKPRQIFSGSPSSLIPSFPGLYNSDVNCWLNSAFQLVNHASSYQKIMGEAPDELRESFNTFQLEIQNKAQCSDVQTQKLREWVSSKNPDVEKEGTQEDPMVFFELVHDETKQYLPLLQQCNNGQLLKRQEFYIPLLLTPNDSKSFQEQFNAFFSERVEDSNTQMTKWFSSTPEGFLVQAKRFWRKEDGTESKIEREIDFPMDLTLSESQCFDLACSYTSDSFIVHHGSTIRKGHYTAYFRRDGEWWHADDTRVTSVRDEEVEEALKTAYIVHYQQSNGLEKKRNEPMLSEDLSYDEAQEPPKRRKIEAAEEGYWSRRGFVRRGCVFRSYSSFFQ